RRRRPHRLPRQSPPPRRPHRAPWMHRPWSAWPRPIRGRRSGSHRCHAASGESRRMSTARALGELLVRQGLVEPQMLPSLLALGEKQGGITDLLVQQGTASEAAIARALADECGFEFIETLDAATIPLDVATKLPITYAKSHRVLLCREDAASVDVLCADPLDVAALDGVRALLGKKVRAQVAPASVVMDAINRVYERQDTMGELASEHEREE